MFYFIILNKKLLIHVCNIFNIKARKHYCRKCVNFKNVSLHFGICYPDCSHSQRSNDKHFPILSVYLLLVEWTESFNNVYLMCEFLIQSFLSWVAFHVAFFSTANFDWLQGFKIIRYVLSYSTTITLNFLFSIACIRRKWK